MFCSKCGKQLNDGEIFCGSCGATSKKSPLRQASAGVQMDLSNEKTETEHTRKTKGIAVMVSCPLWNL